MGCETGRSSASVTWRLRRLHVCAKTKGGVRVESRRDKYTGIYVYATVIVDRKEVMFLNGEKSRVGNAR